MALALTRSVASVPSVRVVPVKTETSVSMELEQSVSAEALMLAERCVLGTLHLLYELRTARVGEAHCPRGAHSYCAAEPCAVRGAEDRAGPVLYCQ